MQSCATLRKSENEVFISLPPVFVNELRALVDLTIGQHIPGVGTCAVGEIVYDHDKQIAQLHLMLSKRAMEPSARDAIGPWVATLRPDCRKIGIDFQNTYDVDPTCFNHISGMRVVISDNGMFSCRSLLSGPWLNASVNDSYLIYASNDTATITEPVFGNKPRTVYSKASGLNTGALTPMGEMELQAGYLNYCPPAELTRLLMALGLDIGISVGVEAVGTFTYHHNAENWAYGQILYPVLNGLYLVKDSDVYRIPLVAKSDGRGVTKGCTITNEFGFTGDELVRMAYTSYMNTLPMYVDHRDTMQQFKQRLPPLCTDREATRGGVMIALQQPGKFFTFKDTDHPATEGWRNLLEGLIHIFDKPSEPNAEKVNIVVDVREPSVTEPVKAEVAAPRYDVWPMWTEANRHHFVAVGRKAPWAIKGDDGIEFMTSYLSLGSTTLMAIANKPDEIAPYRIAELEIAGVVLEFSKTEPGNDMRVPVRCLIETGGKFQAVEGDERLRVLPRSMTAHLTEMSFAGLPDVMDVAMMKSLFIGTEVHFRTVGQADCYACECTLDIKLKSKDRIDMSNKGWAVSVIGWYPRIELRKDDVEEGDNKVDVDIEKARSVLHVDLNKDPDSAPENTLRQLQDAFFSADVAKQYPDCPVLRPYVNHHHFVTPEVCLPWMVHGDNQPVATGFLHGANPVNLYAICPSLVQSSDVQLRVGALLLRVAKGDRVEYIPVITNDHLKAAFMPSFTGSHRELHLDLTSWCVLDEHSLNVKGERGSLKAFGIAQEPVKVDLRVGGHFNTESGHLMFDCGVPKVKSGADYTVRIAGWWPSFGDSMTNMHEATSGHRTTGYLLDIVEEGYKHYIAKSKREPLVTDLKSFATLLPRTFLRNSEICHFAEALAQLTEGDYINPNIVEMAQVDLGNPGLAGCVHLAAPAEASREHLVDLAWAAYMSGRVTSFAPVARDVFAGMMEHVHSESEALNFGRTFAASAEQHERIYHLTMKHYHKH